MSCTHGSRKKQSAPNSFSTNEIGVLCFLVGAEGILCRLLDSVPEAIKKVMQLNPDKGNADEVFADIIKSVAKKFVQTTLTGEINTTLFCSQAPQKPEDIDYSDIFVFIAELVPILDKFFLVNEILSGESTKLLDKIVKIWLSKKWYEYCECNPNPLPDPIDSLQNLEFKGICTSEGNQQLLDSFINNINEGNRVQKEFEAEIKAKAANFGENLISDIAKIESLGGFDIEFVEAEPEQYPTQQVVNSSFGVDGVSCTVKGTASLYYIKNIGFIKYKLLTNVGVIEIKTGAATQEVYQAGQLQVSCVNDCPPPPPPPPPPPEDIPKADLCALFPNDPLCADDPTDFCRAEYITILEGVGCTGFVRPKRLGLNYEGQEEAIEVDVVDCETSDKRVLVLLNCDQAIGVTGCTDPNALNYNPEATIDDGSCTYPAADCDFLFEDNISNMPQVAIQYINDEGYTIERCVNELLLPNGNYQSLAAQFPECDFVTIYINRIQELI